MKLFELKMNPINLGLWISPQGDIIKTSRFHAADIIENPEQFGMTFERIKTLYDKHGENFEQEGEAREEMIKLVLQRGWIRVRNYRNYWSVTVYSLTPKIKEIIKRWVSTFVESETMGKFADLKILEIKSDRLQTVEANGILKDVLEESKGNIMNIEPLKESTMAEQPALELLNEVKLARVYDHFTGKRPVGIITAFRGEEDMETNVRNNKELAFDLRNKGFGFVWVDGAWVENPGTDQELHASETSIMVIGGEGESDKLFDTLKNAAAKYNQEGFVFKPEQGKTAVYDASGNSIMSFNYINIDKLGDAYTRLRKGSHKGRSFVFERERSMKGYIAKLIEQGI
mgnify:FL=1